MHDQAALDRHDQPVQADADDRQGHEGDEHEGRVEEPLVSDVDEDAEAAAGASTSTSYSSDSGQGSREEADTSRPSAPA